MAGKRFLIWDIPVRLFHWLLTLSIIGSFTTAQLGVEYTDYHMRFGYFTLGLLVFRLAWGLWGTRHARFTHFPVKPSLVRGYFGSIFSRNQPASPGHNPLGSLMVFVLLISLFVQALSGLFVDDDILYQGPYNPAVSGDTAKFMTRLHHANSEILLAAIVVHILAVLFYWFYKKQNLIIPMFTGKKELPQKLADQSIQSSRIGIAMVLAIAAALAVYLLLAMAPEPVYDFF